MAARRKKTPVKKSVGPSSRAVARPAPNTARKRLKRLKRVDAERASARVEERLAREEARVRQKVLDDKAKTKRKAQEKKRKAREAITKKKAKERAALAHERAEQRAQATALRTGRRAAVVAERERREVARLQLRAIAAVEKTQRDLYGMSIAELFNHWSRLFAQRPDVTFERLEMDQGDHAEGSTPGSTMPVENMAWLRSAGSIDFSWRFAGDGAQTSAGRWTFDPHETTMDVVWFDHFSARARDAFSAPLFGAGESSLERLARSSIPRFTPSHTLLQLLTERQLTERQAKALLRWLGEGARWLFHESATEEGRRRRRLLEQAARSPTPVSLVDVQLVAALNQGPPLDKSTVQVLLDAHAGFLRAGGGDGRFHEAVVDKLPLITYVNDESVPGQFALSLENLSGLKFTSALLDYANLSGVRCDQGQFSRASLKHACLKYAALAGAHFQDANLSHTDFSGARLVGADFRKANLTGANFERADLTGANFSGANVTSTKFAAANVRGIKY